MPLLSYSTSGRRAKHLGSSRFSSSLRVVRLASVRVSALMQFCSEHPWLSHDGAVEAREALQKAAMHASAGFRCRLRPSRAWTRRRPGASGRQRCFRRASRADRG